MGKKSNNLRLLAEYTDRIKKGDTAAVYEFFAPGFVSHVAKRVAPETLGSDIRAGEVMFWEESAKAFPDREFVIEKVWEVDEEGIVIANWTMTGHAYGRKLLRRTGIREKGGDQRHGDRAIRGRQDRGALGRAPLHAWYRFVGRS